MAKYIPFNKGEKFGRLTALGLHELREYGLKGNRRHYELMKCDCGKDIWIKSDSVKRGHTKSCGCYKTDVLVDRSLKHGGARQNKHDRMYDIYCGILGRCNNPNDYHYQHYGQRGISCLWEKYEDFKDDMIEGYICASSKYGEKNIQIDRIDNDGNYCKENCRRVTAKENNRNRRSNIYVNRNGQQMVLMDVYNSSSPVVKYATFMYRYHHGWSLERALYTPVSSKNI